LQRARPPALPVFRQICRSIAPQVQSLQEESASRRHRTLLHLAELQTGARPSGRIACECKGLAEFRFDRWYARGR